MDLIIAFLLGILQGITEWLPISSSGHLALVQNTFGLDVPVVFDIFIHMGTLVAVCIVYKKDLIAMLKALLQLKFKSKEFNLFLLIILAIIPTAIIGFAFKDFFESMFSNSLLIGVGLIITGIILYLASKVKVTKKTNTKASAFIIGIFQGLAIAPGISRSGATIAIGIIQGIDVKEIAKFTFLLAIPTIIGATVFEVKDLALSQAQVDWFPFLIGALTAAIVGYLSIKFFLKVLEEKKFYWFAYYCWFIGILAIVSSVIK